MARLASEAQKSTPSALQSGGLLTVLAALPGHGHVDHLRHHRHDLVQGHLVLVHLVLGEAVGVLHDQRPAVVGVVEGGEVGLGTRVEAGLREGVGLDVLDEHRLDRLARQDLERRPGLHDEAVLRVGRLVVGALHLLDRREVAGGHADAAFLLGHHEVGRGDVAAGPQRLGHEPRVDLVQVLRQHEFRAVHRHGAWSPPDTGALPGPRQGSYTTDRGR